MKLGINSVSKVFPSVRALDDVSLEFRPGEVHALMGENGAGKSTLIKIITGVYRPDAGSVDLDGKPVTFTSPRDALAAGIGAVHQERNLVTRFSVGENIMLENPPMRRGFIDYATIYKRASELLAVLDPRIDVRAEVTTLSVAQMQLVEIAKALSLNARVLLLDEPTASITDHEAAALFKVIARLKVEGVAIVFVSHKLDEVMAISDRVSVLRDGGVVVAGEAIANMSRQRLVTAMIGREERIAEIARGADADEVVLELEGVSTSYGHAGIDLKLYRTEILGLYGLVGAGRTDLAHAIIGEGRLTAGTLRIKGQTVAIHSPHEALRRWRIGYVSEDRKSEGLVLVHSVGANIAMTIWRRIANALRLVSPMAETLAVTPLVERLSIRISELAQLVGTLSGGNQQKVSLAKWLAAQTDVLIIDEPTVGIDIKTKVELHELLAQIARRQGVAILLISSDMAEMITLADRILVMHNFAVVGEVHNDHTYESTSRRIIDKIHRADADEAHVGTHGHAEV
jgi:ribose transport system ATP-binding protein